MFLYHMSRTRQNMVELPTCSTVFVFWYISSEWALLNRFPWGPCSWRCFSPLVIWHKPKLMMTLVRRKTSFYQNKLVIGALRVTASLLQRSSYNMLNHCDSNRKRSELIACFDTCCCAVLNLLWISSSLFTRRLNVRKFVNRPVFK